MGCGVIEMAQHICQSHGVVEDRNSVRMMYIGKILANNNCPLTPWAASHLNIGANVVEGTRHVARINLICSREQAQNNCQRPLALSCPLCCHQAWQGAIRATVAIIVGQNHCN